MNPAPVFSSVDERLAFYLGRRPVVAPDAFIAPNATVLGAVTLSEGSSVFYGAVLRGDINTIEVGEGSNLQDGVIVHLADDAGVVIGRDVTVGHGAIIHACTIGNECLIGMRATVLDHANIGDRSIVGANSLVPQKFTCPPGSLVLGSPAKVVRQLSGEEQERLKFWAMKYRRVAQAHAALAKK